jgi:phenylalanyl-tRNA synthetase beta chain
VRVPLKWLAEYVPVALPPKEIAHRLTMAGLEVEHIHSTGGEWDENLITVGEVLAVEPHPNADRLRLATVRYGDAEPLTVVCGAPNVAAGQKVAFARAGARLIDGHTGEAAVLKPAKIRGVESTGMVCSERELGLSEEHEGILVLADDSPVGVPLAHVLGETVLDIDVTPNRPDCLSILGVAREVAALTGAVVDEPDHTYEESDEPASGQAAVEIADADLCFRYIASVVEGVKIGPSPRWMQERLTAAGMRPINNIVDITNYVMLELGQPLHAFDYDRLAEHKIVVRRARPGEKMTTLDGIERDLTTETLMICDASRPVAVAGVMGGLESEVTDATTNILLESATFLAPNVRRTAQRLKTRSEASSRFEKGLSPELAMAGAMRATKLLVEIAGGAALRGMIDVYPGRVAETRIALTRRRLEQVLGVDLPTSQVRSALTSLGFGCRWQPPKTYQVRVPYWRTDVRMEDDLAEEVGRVIGYDQIPMKGLSGEVPSVVPQPRRELRERLRDAFAAAGMQEVITYSLTTLDMVQRVMPPEDLATYPPLKVVNPLNADREYLRPTLKASVLKTLASNIRMREGEVALFEAARVYLSNGDDLPDEQEHIVGVVAGRREDRWGHAGEEGVDYYDAKGYVEAALRDVGVEASFEESSEFALVPGRTAELLIEGRRAGTVGQVQPSVASAFDIDQDVYLFELVVDHVLPAVRPLRPYEPASRFPPVTQDLAVVVERDLSAERVRSLIEQHQLVRRARVFDVYEGEQVPAGKKSLAFSVTYQTPDRTLTDEEVAKALDSILQRLKREAGAEIRG